MRIGIILGVVLVGCDPHYYPVGSYSPGPPATIWVSKIVSVGRSCDDIHEQQPDLAERVSRAGIVVHEYTVGNKHACRGCYVCSDSTATHYLKIGAEDEARAKELGFALSTPPGDL